MLKHGRLNAISAIVVSPKRRRLDLHAHLHLDPIDAQTAIAFMQAVLRRERGLLFWFWDNIPFHTDPSVRAFIAKHPRLRVFHFPTYAPDLNPDELVWTQVDEQLASTLIPDTPALVDALSRALCRTRASQNLLRACIDASDLLWHWSS